MRILMKIILAPFLLILTVLVSVLYFLLDLGGVVFSLAAGALAVMGVVSWAWGGRLTDGIALLVMAFLVSPYGLPAVALWGVEKLHDLKDSIQGI